MSNFTTLLYPNINDGAEMTDYAYLVADPRDFLINLAINTSMPWLALRGVDYVGWLGNPSVLTLYTPMAFLLVFFVSFFGFFNGVTAGRLSPEMLILKFKVNNRWIKPALKTALTYAFLSLLFFTFMIFVFNWLEPEASFPKIPLIVFQGLLGGFLAYFIQVHCLLNAKNLDLFTAIAKLKDL